ncbi:ABC transporter substrate-binding protein [Falsiroseomonas oryzae]|uniref:ABC transporter substrate-binding protein n=1 Tax=Falsiroseomonas oryzae TaxID=2766473 RepID=UPI0022EB8DE8|nr:ABC transporter substrate-binding protein [Roseomonas sp. MO-31]
MTRLSRRSALLLGSGALAVPLARPALAQRRQIRFMLDWTPLAHHAAWFLAADRGYFAREGLQVDIQRGYGSGDVVTKIAAGAADFGFGDPGAIVKHNADNPGRAVVNVYQYFDRTLAAVVTLASRGIERPADLRGKRLAAPVGDAGRTLFPAFARANGLSPNDVSWITVAPPLREPMLHRGEADAITAFVSSAFFVLQTLGARPADIRMFRYNDHGVDIYGNGLLTTADYAQRDPGVVRALVRATIAGLRDSITDPAAAVAAIRAREPLTDQALENARFAFTMRDVVLTPAVAANGTGHVDPARARAMVAIVAEAFGVTTPPAVDSFMRTDFLPPQADRMLPTLGS